MSNVFKRTSIDGRTIQQVHLAYQRAAAWAYSVCNYHDEQRDFSVYLAYVAGDAKAIAMFTTELFEATTDDEPRQRWNKWISDWWADKDKEVKHRYSTTRRTEIQDESNA